MTTTTTTASRFLRRMAPALIPFALLGAAIAFVPRTASAVVVRTSVAYRPRPVARTAAVVGTAAVTAAVVGSVVRTLPPSCSSMMVGNVAYQQCSGAWYRPQYSGSQVTYVIVNPPR